MTAPDLPQGFAIRLSDDVLARGDVLVGGSPVTVMRLNAAARSMMATGQAAVGDAASAQLIRRMLATDLAHPDLSEVAPADPKDLTVVIPVRDRPRQLEHTLAALEGLRTVVVDDASLEPGPIADVCARHGAALLSLPQNLGPAGARNHGLAQVDTEFVALVDSDIEASRADLLLLTRHFADPSVALVGPRIRGRSQRPEPRWFERYDAVASALTVGRVPANVRPGARVSWLPGACLVARTSALKEGFDLRLRLGEDVDLVWRLIADGLGVRYDPSVVVEHEIRANAWGWLARIAAYGTSAAPLAERHGRAVAPAVLRPTVALAGAAVLLPTRWSLPAAAVAVLSTSVRVHRVLPETEGRHRLALRLGARAVGWAVRQESSLLLRHWWPAVLPAAIASRNLRRVVATAVVVDSAVAVHGTRGASVPVVLAGRRASDLAYGAGVWYGCWQQRSARALLPRLR